jgi:hypothetical protein
VLLTTPNLEYRPAVREHAGPFTTVENGDHVRRGYTRWHLIELCEAAGLRAEQPDAQRPAEPEGNVVHVHRGSDERESGAAAHGAAHLGRVDARSRRHQPHSVAAVLFRRRRRSCASRTTVKIAIITHRVARGDGQGR